MNGDPSSSQVSNSAPTLDPSSSIFLQSFAGLQLPNPVLTIQKFVFVQVKWVAIQQLHSEVLKKIRTHRLVILQDQFFAPMSAIEFFGMLALSNVQLTIKYGTAQKFCWFYRRRIILQDWSGAWSFLSGGVLHLRGRLPSVRVRFPFGLFIWHWLFWPSVSKKKKKKRLRIE